MKGRDWESTELSSYQEEMAPEIFIKKSSGDLWPLMVQLHDRVYYW